MQPARVRFPLAGLRRRRECVIEAGTLPRRPGHDGGDALRSLGVCGPALQHASLDQREARVLEEQGHDDRAHHGPVLIVLQASIQVEAGERALLPDCVGPVARVLYEPDIEA